jgi:hypothetical protein
VQKAERIGFVDLITVTARLDMKFVERTFGHAGDEAFPDAGVAASGEQIRARTPRIEAADYRNQARVRRPHAEDCARFAVARNQMSAHGFVHAIVAALVEQVEILIGEKGDAVGSGVDRSIRHL